MNKKMFFDFTEQDRKQALEDIQDDILEIKESLSALQLILMGREKCQLQ